MEEGGNIVKVSVIVPVYNVERYLKKSIESIQNQTLKDIEIILVNDGSTDSSLYICREYEESDSRVKVIDKPNGGVSSARNAGMEVASGEYIGFVDPDDWIEPEMYKNMYDKIKKTEGDICICNYAIYNGTGSVNKVLDINKTVLEGQDIRDNLIADMIWSKDLNSNSDAVMGSVCRLVLSKELVSKYTFRFMEDIHIMEDLIFCIDVLLKSSKVAIDRGIYYHYVTNLNSAIHCYKKELIEVEKQVFLIIEKILIKENLYSTRLVERMDMRYVSLHLSFIANEALKENKKKERDKVKLIYDICSDVKLKKILEKLDTSGYTLRKRMILYALRKGHGLLIYIYYVFLIRINGR